MSHWQPGYVLSRHVPPTSSARSSSTKSSIPFCFSRIAMPRPEKPVPMIAILVWGREPFEGRDPFSRGSDPFMWEAESFIWEAEPLVWGREPVEIAMYGSVSHFAVRHN